MMTGVLSACLILHAIVVQASQPSAPAPLEAPLRELPWGQVNFLHSTDTHGWHAGHLQEPSYSADWGDYISFAQRLRERADEDGSDLLLIDTGDRIEGNGLYDASDPKGRYTRDIFKQQHVDVITIGNHELYKSNSSENEYFEMVPNFKGNYLASNIDFIRSDGQQVPLAPRFRKFTTKNQGIRVIAFGFLFNFLGNSNNTIVQKVEDTVNEQWFKDAIRDREVDLFIVAGHVAIRSLEYTLLYQTIRKVQWDTPIQFFGGHTHIRDYKRYDSKSFALESGRYMESLGFQSITGLSTSNGMSHQAKLDFGRRYIDNNLYSFYHHSSTNSSTFPTELGKNVSAQIHSARKSLQLDDTFGCAPKDLWTNRAPYPSEDSIFTWLDSQVMPEMVVEPERSSKPRIIIQNTGALRFDIFKGPFTKDTTYIVSPFTSGFRYIQDVPFALADRVLALLNQGGTIFSDAGLDSSLLAPSEQISIRADVIAQEVPIGEQDVLINGDWPQQPLSASSKAKLTPGYTTKDDAGDDGDDTLHSEISFFRVPNCFESRINTTTTTTSRTSTLVDGYEGRSGNGNGGDGEEGEQPVERVDLVFGDFIQPYVLLALQFLGGEYGVGETRDYVEGKDFTTMVAEWVGRNWNDEC